MNPITQTIKERERIFDRKFGVLYKHEQHSDQIATYTTCEEEIKSHITQSHIALLESVVGVVEGMTFPARGMIGTGEKAIGYRMGCSDTTTDYGKALQALLTKLQEPLKELKK